MSSSVVYSCPGYRSVGNSNDDVDDDRDDGEGGDVVVVRLRTRDQGPMARIRTSTKHLSIDKTPAPGRKLLDPFLYFNLFGFFMKFSLEYSKSASKGTPPPPLNMVSPVKRWDCRGDGAIDSSGWVEMMMSGAMRFRRA